MLSSRNPGMTENPIVGPQLTKGRASWQFMGGPGSPIYRLLDWLRGQLNQAIVNYLLVHTEGASGKVVLEAGSGPASGARAFARQSEIRLSVAIDIDIEALQEARRGDPSLPVVAGDLYHLPFAPGMFHLVWNNSTLEHLEDPQMALAEITRVTRHGGHVFVGVPYRYGPLGFQPLVRNCGIGEWLGPVFTRDRLRELFARSGLLVEDSVIYFFRFFIGALARKPRL